MSELASRAADLPISGSRARLRDVAPDDADLLDAWSADPVVHWRKERCGPTERSEA